MSVFHVCSLSLDYILLFIAITLVPLITHSIPEINLISPKSSFYIVNIVNRKYIYTGLEADFMLFVYVFKCNYYHISIKVNKASILNNPIPAPSQE